MLVCKYVLIIICSNSYRLPIFVRPLSYDLELTPDLVLNNVSGIVKLIFQVFIRVFFYTEHYNNLPLSSLSPLANVR